MAKNLSKKQERQIVSNQQKKLEKFSDSESSLQRGIVICRYGNQADIEDENRVIRRCSIRRTVGFTATGDYVLWHPDESGTETSGIIETVVPRKSELLRPDFYDGLKPVAANVDLVIIVSSIMPELSTNIIDRYLITCRYAHIPAAILINKTDLVSPEELNELENRLAIYNNLGYSTFYISTLTGSGINELRNFMKDKTSVLVGQSGVGKSSTLNALLESQVALTGEISESSGLGQHTTTTARLYHIGSSGLIIDSPGIREFGLWHLPPEKIAEGYIEFAPYLGTCRFKDCQHLSETGCSVREAAENGKISFERYSNYVKIRETLNLLEQRNKTRRANTSRKKNY